MGKFSTVVLVAASAYVASAAVNGGKYAYLAIKGGDYDADGFNAEGYNVWGFNRDMQDKWGRDITDPLAGLVEPVPQFIEPEGEDEDDKEEVEVVEVDLKGDDDDDDYQFHQKAPPPPPPQESLPFPPVVINTPYFTPLWNDRPGASNTPHFCDGSYVEFVVGASLDYEMAAWYLFDVSSLLSLSQDLFHVENMYVINGTEASGSKFQTHILVDFCKAEDVDKVASTAANMPTILSGAGLLTDEVIVQSGMNWDFFLTNCGAAKESKAYVKDGKCLPCPPSPGCPEANSICSTDGVPSCQLGALESCRQGYAKTSIVSPVCQPCAFFYPEDDKGDGCPANLRQCTAADALIEKGLAAENGTFDSAVCLLNVEGDFSFGCNAGFGPTVARLANGDSEYFTGFSGGIGNDNLVCAPCSESVNYEENCNDEVVSAYCNIVEYDTVSDDNFNECLNGCCADDFANSGSSIASPCVAV